MEPIDISTCGYSIMPIIFVILLSGLMTVVLLGLGLRRYNSAVPLAGNCSAAISAACHRPVEDRFAALKPVMWGEIAETGTKRDSESESSSASAIASRSDLSVAVGTSVDGNADTGTDGQSKRLVTPDGNEDEEHGRDDAVGPISLSAYARICKFDNEDASYGALRRYWHCSFTSKEVTTPSPTKLYM